MSVNVEDILVEDGEEFRVIGVETKIFDDGSAMTMITAEPV